MSATCEVPDCPALPLPMRATCGPHAEARTAKDLHIAKDVAGRGGKRCLDCKRQFAPTDWVYKKPKARPKGRTPGDPYGYVHVACEPTSPRLSKKAIREAEKPLFGGL